MNKMVGEPEAPLSLSVTWDVEVEDLERFVLNRKRIVVSYAVVQWEQ